MSKSILFVVDERKMGGVSILLEDMMEMLDLSGLNIDILVLHNNGDRLQNLPKNVNIIYGTEYFDVVDLPIKEIINSKNIKSLIKKIILVFDMKTGLIKNKIKRERKKILSKKYDIEIAFKDGFTAIFTAFGNSLKKIHWLHYDYKLANPNAKYDKLFKKILPLFDNVIAVSKDVMDDFNKIYHLENKTDIIPNLINFDKIKNKSNEVNLPKSNNLEIISIGRLHQVKAYDRFIEVIYRLKEEGVLNNVKFKIYGDGPEKENLLKKIFDLDLKQLVSLEGQVNNPYVYMKNADLFVLCSLHESFGLVIIESLSLGTPVLALRTSATDKLIKNNVDGLIVNNSIDGLYLGLKEILTNKDKLTELKKGAKLFDYSEKNNEIIEQLQNLLK